MCVSVHLCVCFCVYECMCFFVCMSACVYVCVSACHNARMEVRSEDNLGRSEANLSACSF